MSERDQIVSPTDTDTLADSQALAGLLAREGPLVLPFLDLIEQAQVAIDEVVDVMGRATLEAVLQMSAEQLAGPKQQGKKAEREIVYQGTQKGGVALKERQRGVTKPRLRKRKRDDGASGAVEVPASAALQKGGRLANRMLEIMLADVSTRRYEEVLPEMAETAGLSKSQVSREFIEAGGRLLKDLAERDFSETDILVVSVDGFPGPRPTHRINHVFSHEAERSLVFGTERFGPDHVICAVGVDDGGHKHVLGFREGATENAEVATALLEDLVARGRSPFRKRLFVIDGSKALQKAIRQVFGGDNPAQRRRHHKIRNVLGHLPKDQHDQAPATMKAAFKLDAHAGLAKLKQDARWLQRDWPSAAASLQDGLAELFTIS